MSQERYFLYVDGEQRGPYTVRQIGHMVNARIVHEEAMFWCEGLEQWQPVTQLIVPKAEVRKKRQRVGLWVVGALAALSFVGWLAFPLLHQGWKEQNQVEFTPLAAYWRARGVLREQSGTWANLNFAAFDPAKVHMGEENRAAVELEVQSPKSGGKVTSQKWMVRLVYDKKLRFWKPDASGGAER